MTRNHIITFLLLSLSICNFAQPPKQKKSGLADLNLFIKTDNPVDSIWIGNAAQDKEFHYLTYSDTLRIDFNGEINDFYSVRFHQNGKYILHQLLLDGENVIIKGRLTDHLEIDTLIGSDLYYKSMYFHKNYGELLQNNADKGEMINTFLLEVAREFIAAQK